MTCAKMIVASKKDKVFPLVYLLLTLALIISVVTTTFEISFSIMKIIKTQLRNRMRDQWTNDNFVVYIENGISNDNIFKR